MSNQFPEYTEKTGVCAACGNSPCNHGFVRLSATMDLAVARIIIWLGKTRWYRVLARAERNSSSVVMDIASRIGVLLGMLTFGDDVERAASYRSRVVWEEALARGIPMQQMFVLGAPTDTYRTVRNSARFYFESLPIPPWCEQTACGWMDDKYALNTFLRSEGIPVPEAHLAKRDSDVPAAFAACRGRAIAKPRVGSRARHTTTNIGTREEALEAFRVARVLCPDVLFMHHLDGGVCRGTVIGGKLAGFFQGVPPSVTGDGVSSIEELVARKNASKSPRVQDVVLDEEHNNFLSRSGYAFDSVLPKGKRVTLTHRTGRLFGGETRELLPAVHPSLRAYLEKAATALNVPVVGFDCIIPDPERDPDTQTWGIIEANSLPYIDLHYLALYGKPSNPAGALWDLWKDM